MGKWVKKYNVNNYDIWIIFIIYVCCLMCVYVRVENKNLHKPIRKHFFIVIELRTCV